MTLHDSHVHHDMQQDEEIFSHASQLESLDAREKFLDASCCGDLCQRHRIHQLLASHFALRQDQQPFMLDQPLETFEQLMPNHEDWIGSSLGTFQLVEFLGEGGMGLVYLAEQVSPIQRRVAIKVIKPGMDSQSVLMRFESERQTLACLNHPAITHIIDAGTTISGQPYFVMELANGTPITKCCNEHRASLHERIHMFLDVCDAIQHAHQRGIIHRDIKPNNILATKSDCGFSVKVIDFGIAKATKEAIPTNPAATAVGEFLGSPLYMSPEQMLCDPLATDIRTDVYSLGVVLHELLTGVTPLAIPEKTNHGILQIALQVCNVDCRLPSKRVLDKGIETPTYPTLEPQNPRELQSRLRGELDWILMKSLARDRRDRYQSVLDLRRDLERFLANQPVEAAGERSLYRLGKFIQRHRALSSLTALTTLLGLSFVMTTTWLWMVSSRAEKTANRRLEQVLQMQQTLTAERDRAELAARRARVLAQSFVVSEVLGRSAIALCRENPKLFAELDTEGASHHSTEQTAPFPVGRAMVMVLNSNLQDYDPRMIVQSNSDWLADILVDSDVKLEELLRSQEMQTNPTITDEGESAETDHEAVEVVLAFEFPPHAVLRFREIWLAEAQRAFDDQSQFVADAFDSLGLAQLDNHLLGEAQTSFEKSIQIRHDDRHQMNASIQSRLFLAVCLHAQGRSAMSESLFREVTELLKQTPRSNATITGLHQLAQELQPK